MSIDWVAFGIEGTFTGMVGWDKANDEEGRNSIFKILDRLFWERGFCIGYGLTKMVIRSLMQSVKVL